MEAKELELRPLSLDDYEEVLSLWESSPGVGLSRADERQSLKSYLERNPDLSFIALDGARVVAAVLSGHDGRRGYIHHLAVAETHRRLGLGRALVERCLDQLSRIGIQKVHGFIFADNRDGLDFWEAIGFGQRTDLKIVSRVLE